MIGETCGADGSCVSRDDLAVKLRDLVDPILMDSRQSLECTQVQVVLWHRATVSSSCLARDIGTPARTSIKWTIWSIPFLALSGLVKVIKGRRGEGHRIAFTLDTGVTVDKMVSVVNRCGTTGLMTADRTGREDGTFRSGGMPPSGEPARGKGT
jgi:hypothetical protein